MIPSDGRSDHLRLSPYVRNSTIYTIRIEAFIIRILLPTISNDSFRVFYLDCVAITGPIPQYFLRLSNKLIELDGIRVSLASSCIPAFIPFVVDILDRPAIIDGNYRVITLFSLW